MISLCTPRARSYRLLLHCGHTLTEIGHRKYRPQFYGCSESRGKRNHRIEGESPWRRHESARFGRFAIERTRCRFDFLISRRQHRARTDRIRLTIDKRAR